MDKVALTCLTGLLLASSIAWPQSVTKNERAVLGQRDRPFDEGWRFRKGDLLGGERVTLNDSSWRKVDLPHDWSIEDLPKKHVTPSLDAISGEWRFQKGDNPEWKSRELDDATWQKVMLPSTWERHSEYRGDNVYGWFRRPIKVPASLKGRDLPLLLGKIDDADEAWFNGVRIGGTGSFPPNFRSAWDVERRYVVPASLVRGDGSDVLAIRVFDGANDGGIYAAGTPAVRIGPFDPQESENADRTGHTVGGIGWYRKTFTLHAPGQRVAVRFDGVYMNAAVWINGHLLGNHPHGYTSFEYDLTPYLRSGEGKNVLSVQVRNEGKNSRWYSGSGIYRHVWLTVRNPVYVPTWGTFVTTPDVSKDRALVKVIAEVRNDGSVPANVLVRVALRDAAGKSVGVTTSPLSLAALASRRFAWSIPLRSPRLWSPSSPALYTATVEIVQGARATDVATTRFGVRKIEVDALHGFRLNGVAMKLKGGCVHHDNGPLGAMAIDRAEERKVELLKANGYNAVRSSHNPPSPAFLDACDRLGLLVIDEAFDQWNEAKVGNDQDYHRFFRDWAERDIASMVRRDRNHPSIVMWSVGNEIPEQFRAEATQKQLREWVLSNDPTRLITQAICRDWGNAAEQWATQSDPAFRYLDISGYNYLPDKYEPDHALHPERVMVATESYPRDAFQYWTAVERLPYVIGDFVWTAMDYLGEAGLAHNVLSNEPNPFFMPFPWVNAWSGDLDLCGFKKPQSFYRDILWQRSPLEMAVHAPIPSGLSEVVSAWGWPNEIQSWNWKGSEGKPLQVSIYSTCDRVRLVLNGKVIGEKPVSAKTKLTAKFEVPYAPGELTAIGLTNGKAVSRKTLRTAGTPKQLRLTVDRKTIRADRNDLAYVTVEVLDDRGERVPNAEVDVRLAVSGAGELCAQCNGAPDRPASFRAPICTTFQGRALAVLRPLRGLRGAIHLTASAKGLRSKTMVVQTK